MRMACIATPPFTWEERNAATGTLQNSSDAKTKTLFVGDSMAQMATQLNTMQSDRMRALVVPREHGAWGILLVPLVIGACVGLRSGRGLSDIALLLVAAISIFWLRTPVESLLGTSPLRATTKDEKRMAAQATAIVAAIAIAASFGLLHGGRNLGLLFIACVAGTAFAAQSALKLFGRRMRMPAQIIGSIGLTATAAAAYYVATGRLDTIAISVWLACWLFAGDQIHYVQVRLHAARAATFEEKISRGRQFFAGQFVLMGAVGAACYYGWLPPLAILAFIPIVIRGAMWFFQKPEKLDIPWLGITELLHSITFGMLLITSFYMVR